MPCGPVPGSFVHYVSLFAPPPTGWVERKINSLLFAAKLEKNIYITSLVHWPLGEQCLPVGPAGVANTVPDRLRRIRTDYRTLLSRAWDPVTLPIDH